MIRSLLVFFLITLTLPLRAETYPEYRSLFVNDYADILSAESEQQLTSELSAAKDARGIEMTVLTLPRLSDFTTKSIETYAKNLFNHWGIGDAETNDGVLILVAFEDRKIRIAIGDGYPAVYDGVASRIIRVHMQPAFKDGRFEDGIESAVRNGLVDFDVSKPPSEPSLNGRIAEMVNKYWPFGIVAGFAAMIGLPLSGISGWVGRRLFPRKCPECARRMRILGNAQEKNHLDEGQLMEQDLDSTQYDVWVCDRDGHVTISRRPGWKSRKMRVCQECNYHTVESYHRILRGATTTREGEKEIDLTCRKCGHHRRRTQIIPLLVSSTDNDSFGGSSGFGGGGGGGFGGGSSSGGGGSGSW